MASIPAWLWVPVGWTLLAAGVVLLLIGRVRTSRRSGARCARCGYDMAGLGSMTCPECGRTARNQRELLRVPSSKRMRAAGLLLMLLGWLGMQAPEMVARGWVAAVPGWTLALAGPTSGGPNANVVMVSKADILTPAYPMANPTSVASLIKDALFMETVRRLRHGELAGWEANRFVARCMLDPVNRVSVFHYTRSRWPWDRPIPTYVDECEGWTYSYEPFTGPARTMRVRANLVLEPKARIDVTFDAPIDATMVFNDYLEKRSTPELDAAVLAALCPRVVIQRGRFSIEVDDRNGAAWNQIDCAVEFKVRVLMEGREMGHGVCNVRAADKGQGNTLSPGMWWGPQCWEAVNAEPEKVELEITGDPLAATERALGDPWGKERSAWSGVVRCKPPVERK